VTRSRDAASVAVRVGLLLHIKSWMRSEVRIAVVQVRRMWIEARSDGFPRPKLALQATCQRKVCILARKVVACLW